MTTPADQLKADVAARGAAVSQTLAVPNDGSIAAAAKRSQAAASNDPKRLIKREIEVYKTEVATALPVGYIGGADRFARTVLTAISTDKTNNLVKCTPKSIIGAALQAAQLGLSVGVMGEAWLVPYRNGDTYEASFQLGYKGLIALAARANIMITAHVVHENDHFEYELGLEPKLRHVPIRGARGRSELWYAIARDRTNGAYLASAVVDFEYVEKRRKANRGKSPAWDQWSDEMALTKAVRAVCRFLPMTVEMSAALASDGVVRTDLQGTPEEHVNPYADDDVVDGEVID
jgi:recombination protein RecT